MLFDKLFTVECRPTELSVRETYDTSILNFGFVSPFRASLELGIVCRVVVVSFFRRGVLRPQSCCCRGQHISPADAPGDVTAAIMQEFLHVVGVVVFILGGLYDLLSILCVVASQGSVKAKTTRPKDCRPLCFGC